MQIKKGDNVIVATGKDKSKKGKVLRAFPADNKVIVEGVNIKKKRQRPRKSNEKGQTLEMPHPVNASNVLLYCSACGAGRRTKVKMNKDKKLRVCVKCQKEM